MVIEGLPFIAPELREAWLASQIAGQIAGAVLDAKEPALLEEGRRAIVK